MTVFERYHNHVTSRTGVVMNDEKESPSVSRKRKADETGLDDGDGVVDLDSDVTIRAGKRSAVLTDSERQSMMTQTPSFIAEAMDEDRVVHLPMFAHLNENAWRVLFSSSLAHVTHSELLSVYRASLYLGIPDNPGLRYLVADRFERCKTWVDFQSLLEVWSIGVEQNALPPVVLPGEQQPLFPGSPLHNRELTVFHGQHFAALAARLANVTLTSRGNHEFIDFYRQFNNADFATQLAFFNIFHAFAHRYFRNYEPISTSLPLRLFDIYQYLPRQAQIACPHYVGKTFNRSWNSERAAVSVRSFTQVAPETGPVPFAVFKERFDKATAGLFLDAVVSRHFQKDKFCVLSGGTVAQCLSSNYTEESMKGRDVDIFIGVRNAPRYSRFRTGFYDDFYTFFKRITNPHPFYVKRQGNIVEFVCEGVPTVPKFQFILLDSFDAAQTLNRFDIASRMVTYNGSTVRATYDGLQAWFTGIDMYDPVTKFRQVRFDKFRQSGFKLFATPRHADFLVPAQGVVVEASPIKVWQSSALNSSPEMRLAMFTEMLQLEPRLPLERLPPDPDYDLDFGAQSQRGRRFRLSTHH